MKGWKRTYWAVWTANLITAIGMMSFLPFFPSLLEDLGVPDRQVAPWAGALFGAAPLSATVMGPVWGALGDRIGRRVMVVRALLAISVFVGAMAFATSPWQLLALRTGQGLFSGFIAPSITLVSVAAPADRQGRVAGNLQTALALGAMIGPAIGGMFAASGQPQRVFLWVGAAALVSAALVALFAREDASHRLVHADRGTRRGAASELASGLLRDLADTMRNPRVRGAVVLVTFLQFGLGATNPLLELYVREVAGGEAGGGSWARLAAWLPGVDVHDRAGALALATSLLFAAAALFSLLALPAWGRTGDLVGHRRALTWCGIGSALALFVQAAAPLYGVLLLGRVLMGIAIAGSAPLAFGLAAGEIEVARRGGAFGVVFSARTLSVAVGGMAGGALAGVLGIRGLMVLSGAIVLAALALLREGRQPAASVRSEA